MHVLGWGVGEGVSPILCWSEPGAHACHKNDIGYILDLGSRTLGLNYYGPYRLAVCERRQEMSTLSVGL